MNGDKSKSGKTHFRARARLLSIIGKDLISDESIAIIELVKNSYDADATRVEVTMGSLLDAEKSFVEVKDNGIGMTLDIILNKWMEIGTSSKLQDNSERISKKFNRPFLGEKGVGRFAADKLGSKLQLTTRAEMSDEEVVLETDTEIYGTDTYLEEIAAEWKTRTPEELIKPPNGTILRITKLRDKWMDDTYHRQKIENIVNVLSRLLSPFTGASDFEIIFNCPDFGLYNKKLDISKILKKAIYRLEGEINDRGILTYKYNEIPQKPVDLAMEHIPLRHAINTRDILDCGTFKIYLYAWDLDIESLEKAGMDQLEVGLLKAKDENSIGGVSIYRDGFRLFPYGMPWDDWLNLTLKRLQRPGAHISNNQIIGFIELSRERNPNLKDKTNREGLVEDGFAFNQFRSLVQLAVSDLARRRQIIRLEKKKKLRIEGDKVISLLAEAREKFSEMTDVYEEITRIEKEYESQKRENEERLQTVTQLAAFGLMAEVFTHEFARNLRHAFQHNLKIRKELKESSIVDDLQNTLDVMREQLKILQPMYYAERKKSEDLDMKDVFSDVKKAFESYLGKNNVSFDYTEENTSLHVKINRGHILMAISNLVDNALFWLESSGTPNAKITMRANGTDDSLIVSDNGPGIREEIKDYIFEPFITTKKDGRGLGLYITKNLLNAYNGEIFLTDNKENEEGTSFKIQFSKDVN